MAKTEATVINFEKEKDTKNTVKFSEKPDAGKPAVIGTLYLQKWFIGDTEKVSVTINKAA